jgi:hypothetical protein
MPYYYLFEVGMGGLISESDAAIVPQTPQFAVKVYDTQQLVPGRRWNSARREFEDFAPPRQPVLSPLEFLQRFTAVERIKIRALAKADPVVEDYMHLLDLATTVNLDDADTVNGLNYLTTGNDPALTLERVAAIRGV